MFAIQMTGQTLKVYMNEAGQWSSMTVAKLYDTEAEAQAVLQAARLRAGMRRFSRVVAMSAEDLKQMAEDAAKCLECAIKHGTAEEQVEWRNRFDKLAALAI